MMVLQIPWWSSFLYMFSIVFIIWLVAFISKRWMK